MENTETHVSPAPGIPAAKTQAVSPLSAAVTDQLRGHDREALRQRFSADNEFLVVPDWLEPTWVEKTLARRARELVDVAHRNYVPGYKKGASISYFTLAEQAPEFVELYHHEELRRFFSQLVGVELMRCPERDPHACALYYYTEPGDRVGFHYDTSWYKGVRYTVLLGLVQESQQCRLMCELHKDDPERETREETFLTEPGTMVVFNGDKLWHAVSPLAEGEQRIVLTMEYVTDPRMNAAKRFVSNIKDSIAYFGIGGVWRRRPRRA